MLSSQPLVTRFLLSLQTSSEAEFPSNRADELAGFARGFAHFIGGTQAGKPHKF